MAAKAALPTERRYTPSRSERVFMRRFDLGGAPGFRRYAISSRGSVGIPRETDARLATRAALYPPSLDHRCGDRRWLR
ncbi:MAG: hypothetical protein AAF715_09720 [Myxococcota bacterium]